MKLINQTNSLATKATLILGVLLLAGCATAPSQFIHHPYPGSPTEGFDIPAPENKIVIIFNHGSREEWRRDYCTPTLITLPDVIKQLSGKTVDGKEIVLYHHCSTPRGGYIGALQNGEPKLIKRTRLIEETVQAFNDAGVPSQQLFLAGHSAGGWALLLVAQRRQVSFNAVIAFGPAFAGKKHNRSAGWQTLRDRQAAQLASTAHIDALVYTFADDAYENSEALAFLANIDGIELIAVDERMCDAPYQHRTAFRHCFTQSQREVILRFIKVRMGDEE